MAMENIEIESDEQIDSEERLSYMVMKRNWEEVLKIFRAYPEFRANRIDHRNSNTALHAAIINGAPESIIGQMVDLIVVVDTLTLSAGNYEGDTPLHCAAARGSVYICQRILQVDKSLVRTVELMDLIVCVHTHTLQNVKKLPSYIVTYIFSQLFKSLTINYSLKFLFCVI